MKTAGQRNRKIVIETRTVTTADDGTEIESWANHCECWAAISYGTGQERREAAQEQAAVTATFFVPENANTRAVDPESYRIIFEGTWDVISAVPSPEYNRERHLTAVKRAG